MIVKIKDKPDQEALHRKITRSINEIAKTRTKTAPRLPATIVNKQVMFQSSVGIRRFIKRHIAIKRNCSRSSIVSKNNRTIQNKQDLCTENKLIVTSKEEAKQFFKAILELPSVRHRNAALRVWNGDVMSRARLSHMGLADNNLCLYCGNIETQQHVILDCQRAKDLWDRVAVLSGGDSGASWLGKGDLELQMECLWHLLNSKELEANEIWHRSLKFIETVRKWKTNGQGDINIDQLL